MPESQRIYITFATIDNVPTVYCDAVSCTRYNEGLLIKFKRTGIIEDQFAAEPALRTPRNAEIVNCVAKSEPSIARVAINTGVCSHYATDPDIAQWNLRGF